ncbi:unnamed protein product, partial [marine sediment metagenome]
MEIIRYVSKEDIEKWKSRYLESYIPADLMADTITELIRKSEL